MCYGFPPSCAIIIIDDAPGWVLGHTNPHSLVLHQTCPGGTENWKHGDTIGGKGCWNKLADEDLIVCGLSSHDLGTFIIKNCGMFFNIF
jgi:hypothetical protein